jgi:hypothetical protein
MNAIDIPPAAAIVVANEANISNEEITKQEEAMLDEMTDEEGDKEEEKLVNDEPKFEWTIKNDKTPKDSAIKRLPIFLRYIVFVFPIF